jgi:hypothetical protein
MKGFLRLCGLFLLSCFANEAAMAQGVLDPYENATPVQSKSNETALMNDKSNAGNSEEGMNFDPEKSGYVKTEEDGKVIYVKKTGRLDFRYQPK